MTDKMTPAGEEYLRLWDELEHLWDTGRGESDEAHALRDRMDAPWRRMTGADRDALTRHAQAKNQRDNETRMAEAKARRT